MRPTCRSRAAIARSRAGVATLVAIFLDALGGRAAENSRDSYAVAAENGGAAKA
jgi:hypothetical protein